MLLLIKQVKLYFNSHSTFIVLSLVLKASIPFHLHSKCDYVTSNTITLLINRFLFRFVFTRSFVFAFTFIYSLHHSLFHPLFNIFYIFLFDLMTSECMFVYVIEYDFEDFFLPPSFLSVL